MPTPILGGDRNWRPASIPFPFSCEGGMLACGEPKRSRFAESPKIAKAL